MRFPGTAAAMLLSGSALAQEACTDYKDAILRLECYERTAAPPQCAVYAADWQVRGACLDLLNGRPVAPTSPDEARMCLALKPDELAVTKCFEKVLPPPKASAIEPRKSWTVQVREQSLTKFYKLGEPAQVGYKHENGRSDPLLKAALLADGSPLGFIKNWNWFLSTDLNIDLSSPGKQRANTKSVGGGTLGVLFDYFERHFAIDSTVRLTEKIDSELQTHSTNLVVGNLLAIKSWADGAPWAKETTWQVVPAFGLNYEKLHKVETGKPKGNRSSAYGGVNAAIWPSIIPRTQLSVKLQRFVDTAGSASLSRRQLNYAILSAEYFLYDPTKDNVIFTPRLALVREVGSDPLTGSLDKNRTLLVFKFTLN